MSEVILKNVIKKYNGKAGISISFEVKPGEYFTICGPTGSGKSTLMRMIAGLEKVDDGQIFIGKKMVNKVAAEDRKIGMVFEHPTYAIFPHYNLLENVIYGPRVKGGKITEIQKTGKEMLEMMLLDDRADFYWDESSGGMLQRISLARALMTSDKLILLDEPLSALDAKIRMALRYELMSIIKEVGVTCIHATQDTEEALMVSDRILVLNKGVVEQIGTPLEIYQHPANLFVARFMCGCNVIEGKIIKKNNTFSEIQLAKNITIKASDTSFSENDKVAIAIRAEHIDVEGGKVNGDNSIKGVIQSSRFTAGNNIDEILLETGDVFFSKKHATHIWFSRGDDVTISFKPENIILFPYPVEGLEKALELN